jgi:hypothetical protein
LHKKPPSRQITVLPVYSKNGDEGVDCDEDADDMEDDAAGDVLEHGEAGQGNQDKNEDGVEDAPQAPHQHQRVLLLAEKNIVRGNETL